MTDIPLHLIRPNPFRDFELHPIDEAQVAKLKESIGADGFWVSVVARQVDEQYEIAFGHHRIEAARGLGMDTVPIEVRELSDWQMVRMLASENATQRGTTAAASLDAIAAICRTVVRQCRSGDAAKTAKFFAVSDKVAERMHGSVLTGDGPGERCVLDVLPEAVFTQNQVRQAVGVLKDSGRMATIMGRDNASSVFDARCAKLFRLDYHLAEFRRYVTDETVRSYLPVERQFEFGQKIVAAVGGELTAIKLRERANVLLYEQAGVARNKARRASQRFTDDRVRDALNLMRRGAHSVKQSCNMIADLLAEDPDVLNGSTEIVGRFSQYVSDIDTALKTLAHGRSGKRGINLRLIVDNKEKSA